ncbi:MAG: YceI family protein [Flavobacteriaceae bacterium]|nr:MAG: YceI family protein [Flavobacteriaceae bacterium]
MKKAIATVIVIFILFSACKGEKKGKIEAKEEVKVEKTETVNNVDITASLVTWKGSKSGGSHHGTVSLKQGSLIIKDGAITSGDFVIDMASIKNEDLSPDYGAKLVKHLSSDDFFDIEKFPTARFIITSVEQKEDTLAVTGNLTIKDVTKSITIPATLTEEGAKIFKSDTFAIDRADFNVKYGSKRFFPSLEDKIINDLVEMSFSIKVKGN